MQPESTSHQETEKQPQSIGDIFKKTREMRVELKPKEDRLEKTKEAQEPVGSQDEDLRLKVETLEKRSKGTQKAYNEISQKLKSYQKTVNKYVEEGLLNEEEAKSLLNETIHEELAFEDENDNPLKKFFKIGNEGITKIRQSIEEGLLDLDPLLDKKIRAFDSFLEDASREEVQAVIEDLSKLEGNSVKLAKKMIEIGQTYYEEVYGDIEESGNLRNFKKKYQQEIEQLQKTIDKQEKQILKYQQQQNEGYLPSKTYNLPSGGNKDVTERKESSAKSILDRARRGELYGS